MTKQAPRKMSAQGGTKQGRRAFLARSAAGGVGASLVLYGAEPARAEFDAPCELQASSLDALVALKDSVYELQSALYRQSFKEIRQQVDRTIDYFDQLCRKVGELKAALVAERKGVAYEQMKALADIGCVSAGQMKDMSSVGKAQAQLSSLDAISQQLRQMASELLPEGQGVTLSVEATRILREIIIIVDTETVGRRKQLLAAMEQARRTAGEYDAATDAVQSFLSAAIGKIAEPNSAGATADLVQKAGDELTKLHARLQTTSMLDEAQKTEVLIALADGTRQWIAGEGAERAGSGGAVVFRQAAYRRAPAAPVAVVTSAEVSGLIYNFYPPEGYFKLGKCLLLVKAIRLSTWVKSATREQVLRVVQRGLDMYHLSCREYQGRGCQRDRFVQELANIITR